MNDEEEGRELEEMRKGKERKEGKGNDLLLAGGGTVFG
jgi:hypothetical protein